MDMPGRFAVVIHGEYDCVNCFRHNEGRSSWQYFSTRLTEGQLTSGETEGPLRRCLELIVEHDSPDAIIVLGTCPVEVIGDQFDVVVDAVSAETGVPMVALHTSGLKLSTQQEMLDWCFDTLAGLGQTEAPAPAKNEVALIGMPCDTNGTAELRNALDGASFSYLADFPDGARLQDWKRLTHCEHVVVSDRSMFPRLIERVEKAGSTITEVPLPYGLEQTRAVYDHFKNLSDTPLKPAHGTLQAKAEAAIENFRSRWVGARMAVTVRMYNSNHYGMVARGGLGHVRLFTELGLDVTVLIQGSPDPSTRSIWTDLLAEHELDVSFDIFPGPYALTECLTQGQFQFACVADTLHHEAAASGVPLVFSHQMRPWLTGVVTNIAHLNRAMESNL